jgi:hypothetical protein
MPAPKPLKKSKKSSKIITNIPGMIQEGMEEAVKITASMVERMADDVEGLFAKFNEAGDLLQSL